MLVINTLDTVNINVLTNSPHTNLPNTIAKFIANYIKKHKRSETSPQRQFGVSQWSVLSLRFFNVYTSDIPIPHMTYTWLMQPTSMYIQHNLTYHHTYTARWVYWGNYVGQYTLKIPVALIECIQSGYIPEKMCDIKNIYWKKVC